MSEEFRGDETSSMPTLRHITTALPRFRYGREDIIAAGQRWLEADPEKRALFDRFLRSSRISDRYFCIPLEQIFSLNGSQRRAEIFSDSAKELAIRAVRGCFSHLQPAPPISTLITTSCSCPIIPALDTALIDEFEMSRAMRRVPLYQHGCAGGAVALGLARSFSDTLIVSVELCSLVFHRDDLRAGNLLGSALFGDGAACAYVGSAGAGLEFVDQRSFLIPQSDHLMGYEILDSGAHLKLDRELPAVLAECTPGLIHDLLRKNGLTVAEVDYWLVHPGGARILEIMVDALAIDPDRMRWSAQVLERYGNMASATLLFVIGKFMQEWPCAGGDVAVAMGVGPGLTVELMLFEAKDPPAAESADDFT